MLEVNLVHISKGSQVKYLTSLVENLGKIYTATIYVSLAVHPLKTQCISISEILCVKPSVREDIKDNSSNLISFQWRIKGGRRGRPPPPGVQILSISCSFWENSTNSYVGAPPPWGVGAPSSGKSWIRHWFCRFRGGPFSTTDVDINLANMNIWRNKKVLPNGNCVE